jgi:hypothetical protein
VAFVQNVYCGKHIKVVLKKLEIEKQKRRQIKMNEKMWKVTATSEHYIIITSKYFARCKPKDILELMEEMRKNGYTKYSLFNYGWEGSVCFER